MVTNTDNFVRDPQRKLYFKNILRKIFFEDWLMKLVALVITFALWVGVTGLSKPTTQRMNGIPLTLRFGNNVDAATTTQEIDIIISGDKRKIDQINRNDLVVSLDLTDVPPGDRVIQMTPNTVSITLPNGVKLDEIQPPQIVVKLETVQIKEVPVNAVTEGQLPEGFEIYSQAVNPQKISVRGPATLIRALSSVTTDKIDLSNRNADFTARQVSVNVSNPKAVLLETVVDVSFRIGEKRVERTFQVPVKGDSKHKVAVVLYGAKSLFDQLKPEDITVEIEKDAAGKETPTVTLPSSLGANVEIRKPKADR
ncbi:MAG: YbbR-like domain-containing protein [Acidobacteria bacterium]|nr:YbbR-like domain-containing protein [Acidobacteriota bacterium]